MDDVIVFIKENPNCFVYYSFSENEILTIKELLENMVSLFENK